MRNSPETSMVFEGYDNGLRVLPERKRKAKSRFSSGWQR